MEKITNTSLIKLLRKRRNFREMSLYSLKNKNRIGFDRIKKPYILFKFRRVTKSNQICVQRPQIFSNLEKIIHFKI